MKKLIPIVSNVLQRETVGLLPVPLRLLARFQTSLLPAGARLDPGIVPPAVRVPLEELESNVLRTSQSGEAYEETKLVEGATLGNTMSAEEVLECRVVELSHC